MFRIRKKREEKITFLEDSYSQIELIPSENKEFALAQMDKIDSFSTKNQESFGYRDVLMREVEPKELITRKILLSDAERSLTSLLKYHREVYCLVGSKLVRSKSTVAFGFSKLQIMVTLQDRIIKSIWINGYTKNKDDLTPFKTALEVICKMHNLIICDWEASELIEITETEKFNEYVKSFLLNI
ncbi:hypothetical protein [Wukongibacter baidiensis]